MGFLTDKRALVLGLASERSIAWGIAKAMRREGAEVALTYQSEKLKPRVEKFASQLGSDIVLACDVADDQQVEQLMSDLDNYWDGFDILVHSIAFAPREELVGTYLDAVTRKGFLTAHEISSYSFAALAKAARPMMIGRKAALLTLSYIGSIRSMPGYNVMGIAKASLEANVRYLAQSMGRDDIRVNAISAGPIKTLAAAGIGSFRKMLQFYERATPLQRGVTIDEVGNAAAFLCSDLASGITGEITYVDAGFNTVGLSEELMEALKED